MCGFLKNSSILKYLGNNNYNSKRLNSSGIIRIFDRFKILRMYKIKSRLVNGVVKEIIPGVYYAAIDDDYDRAMLFCRYQEFYESPYKNIRNKYFTLPEFMRTYTKERGATMFTYPYDWTGYNIPSNILEKANNKFYKETEYDKVMNGIYFHCSIDSQNKNGGERCGWYLIGAGNADIQTMNHEIAHGLYFTDKAYKKACNVILDSMKKGVYNSIKKALIKLGYADDEKIIRDEMQAFLSTGIHNSFNSDQVIKYSESFKENFKYYYESK
jgi:hypothetical protein